MMKMKAVVKSPMRTTGRQQAESRDPRCPQVLLAALMCCTLPDAVVVTLTSRVLFYAKNSLRGNENKYLSFF